MPTGPGRPGPVPPAQGPPTVIDVTSGFDAPPGPTPAGGRAVRLQHGVDAADLTTIGASLRTLTHDGRDLVVPFGEDEVRPLYRGAVLAPWPNRIVDGRYRFQGEEQQLALSEPERGHALHGLVSWLDFAVMQQTDDTAVLQAAIVPQVGYPFAVTVRVTYRLDDDGLTTTVSALNSGPGAAPFGTSAHPYLVGGEGRVDDWSLQFAAAELLQVTEDRLVPSGLAPIGADFDFAERRVIGATFIDHAFTSLVRQQGVASVRLFGADGSGVQMTWGDECPWVQLHTADRPEPAFDRVGLAVEPMTCPPDAFNSGTDLIVLQPGGTTTAAWRIAAL